MLSLRKGWMSFIVAFWGIGWMIPTHFGQKRLLSILCNNSSRWQKSTKPCQANTLFRLTEQLKKGEVQGSSSTTDSLQAQFNWTEVRRSLHSHSKTKRGTELSTFPTVHLNFILTAKEINCHMPPTFLLQTSCAMLQKPQQKLAQVSW